MKKIKAKFIDFKNLFLNRFNENKFKTILEILIIVVYFAFSSLLPTMSNSDKFHLIPFFIAGVMALLMLMWIIFYGKVYLDYPTIMMSLFLLFNVFSTMINGFKEFNRTAVILPILFLFIYQYLKNTKTIESFAYITFLGYLFFAAVFSIYYAKELIALDFKRLGDAFGNVNGIGTFFAIGFAFSMYYGIIKKRYHNLVFSVVLLFLSSTTGSKAAILLVAVSLVIVVVVKFGLKKWYITISMIVAFVILGVIILNIPAFSYLQTRILKMFEVFLGTGGSKVDGSTVSRLNMVYEGIYSFLQKPIFGWGHGGFRNEISSYGMYSHNNYIDLVSNYGLMGFLTFESIIFIPLFKYISRKKLAEDENKEQSKKLVCLMMIFSVFIVFAQFTGVQSLSKVDYILLALISVISTECYQKNLKTPAYVPTTTRTFFSKIDFIKTEDVKTNELETQIVSLKNLFSVIKEKIINNKKYFLETMSSIKNPDNKILVLKERVAKEKIAKKEISESAIKPINKKDMIFNSAFIIFIAIQGTLAFSFSFYNSKPHLLNSAIEIANRQQINNEDPYVSFADINSYVNYSETIFKQGEENREFKTLNPYIKFNTHSFSYDGQSFNLAGITAKNLFSDGTSLKGIDLPIVFKDYILEPLNGANYAVMITSKTASSLINTETTDLSSLVGEVFLDSNSRTYSINNIIYNVDIPIPESTGSNQYSDEKSLLSNHLSRLNNDYIFYITLPTDLLATFKYSFAYYPEGRELLDYIDKYYENYGADKNNDNLLEFSVLNGNDSYTLSENYSIINTIYVTYNNDSSQIYQILLTVISVVLFAINFAIIFDISRKYKNGWFLYITLVISMILCFVPLILVQLLSKTLQVHVLANQLTFIYIIVYYSSLFLFLLIQKIIHLIRIKKNEQ